MDGLGGVLFRFPFRVPAYYALILRSLTVLEGLALQVITGVCRCSGLHASAPSGRVVS